MLLECNKNYRYCMLYVCIIVLFFQLLLMHHTPQKFYRNMTSVQWMGKYLIFLSFMSYILLCAIDILLFISQSTEVICKQQHLGKNFSGILNKSVDVIGLSAYYSDHTRQLNKNLLYLVIFLVNLCLVILGYTCIWLHNICLYLVVFGKAYAHSLGSIIIRYIVDLLHIQSPCKWPVYQSGSFTDYSFTDYTHLQSCHVEP